MWDFMQVVLFLEEMGINHGIDKVQTLETNGGKVCGVNTSGQACAVGWEAAVQWGSREACWGQLC